MSFGLSIYPWIHSVRYNNGKWDQTFTEQRHLTPKEESTLSEAELQKLSAERNTFPGLPLVNYTTQYGMGCFEGIKAYPQKDGSLSVFRPERNCARMHSSMKGLRMPAVDEELLLGGIMKILKHNRDLGFTPEYKSEWENDYWQSGDAVYIRPFTYSEPGIGVGLSGSPWVITVCTTVSKYFSPGNNDAITTERVRATPNGIGWIKTAANYVTSALARSEAADDGYMEAVFLDSENHQNIEEGSSSNFFALFPGGRLVTPQLRDTILPGITRESVITLARDRGIDVAEADLSVDEVLNSATECFVTGTAAGITPLSSLTHKGRKSEFSSLNDDSLSISLLKELKEIQYGAREDRFEWMSRVL